jgi:hypothetical protein
VCNSIPPNKKKQFSLKHCTSAHEPSMSQTVNTISCSCSATPEFRYRWLSDHLKLCGTPAQLSDLQRFNYPPHSFFALEAKSNLSSPFGIIQLFSLKLLFKNMSFEWLQYNCIHNFNIEWSEEDEWGERYKDIKEVIPCWVSVDFHHIFLKYQNSTQLWCSDSTMLKNLNNLQLT